MSIFDIFRRNKPQQKRGVQFLGGSAFSEVIGGGYHRMSENPEIVGACFRIAQLIASMTIYLMANTERGDIRINNELSRKIDIEPYPTMTRSDWMTAIMMTMLLYGDGNAIVYPHTANGYLNSLEPIPASRVGFSEIVGTSDYRVLIDNVSHDPRDLLHFRINPNRDHLWLGQGFRVPLKKVVDSLGQAAQTEQGFMQSKWKPSLIVKVDALTDEFSSPEGRQRLLDSYVSTNRVGEPWLIPAEQFSVEQVKPLSLSDLALSDMVTLDKRTVASVLGVPPFLLGIGDYKVDEWNGFVSNTLRPIAQGIEQEMTRKLILSPKMYLRFNVSKLYSYDLKTVSDVFGSLYDKGIVDGNEVRNQIGFEPRDGLDELHVLENYIPVSQIGDQNKLGGNSNAE